MKRIIILTASVFLMSVLAHGWFYANWPCILYDGQCVPEDSQESSIQSLSPSLGRLSIEAAGFFLQSSSDYQAFLKKIELADIYGINYAELTNLIDNSIENMETAHSIYRRVWKTSKKLERNPVIFEKLTQFDYRLISEEKGLIPSISCEVENFLKMGNMPGAFEKIYNDTGDILQMMKSLKSLAEANSIDIPQCWEVNQQFLKSGLFGQYISQVFSEIRKSIM